MDKYNSYTILDVVYMWVTNNGHYGVHGVKLAENSHVSFKIIIIL